MSTPLAATITTPDGAFTIVMEAGAVLASGWADDLDPLLVLIHPRLRPPRERIATAHDDVGMRAAQAAVSRYYDGDVGAPAVVPVLQHSGEFRRRAWEVLRDVPAGTPITYTEFAARAGSPAAVRAAAGACAFNAAALFVPCHRVLRLRGALGGFRYGAAVKERLLEREAATPRGARP